MYLKPDAAYRKMLFDTPRLLPGSIRRYILCVLILLQAAACTGTAVPERKALPGWFPSMDALVNAVVDAVSRNDRNALESLCISEQEYALHVWPDLPIARIPQWQSQRYFVWTQHQLRSANGLNGVLKNYGGRRYTVLKAFFKENKIPYEHCTVHGAAMLQVRDDSGVEQDLRLFGSIVEKEGFYKIFSYNTD
jgi:hypothetical protein